MPGDQDALDLMPLSLRAKIPKLYSMDGWEPEKVPIAVKIFGGPYTGFFTEFDGEDTLFGFARIKGLGDGELGYSSLSELQSLRLPFRLERDLYFGSHTLAEVKSGKAY